MVNHISKREYRIKNGICSARFEEGDLANKHQYIYAPRTCGGFGRILKRLFFFFLPKNNTKDLREKEG